MPRLSVWFVRLALVYLGLGFTLGASLLLAKGQWLPPTLMRLLPIHAELLLVGWMMQLAMGVSYWILPRLNTDNERGSELPVRLALLTLNAGVLSVCVGIWSGVEALLLIGRGLEATAALGYALHMRPRLQRPSLR
jgi:cbb3-type cytochrome oxidase subunit 1